MFDLSICSCSGSVDATRVLLEAGARVSAENNIGRTAAQLGAFVGKIVNCHLKQNNSYSLLFYVDEYELHFVI